jgi:hypothetical protein
MRHSPFNVPNKKADVVKCPEVFTDAGLLFNEPPGQTGLLFV